MDDSNISNVVVGCSSSGQMKHQSTSQTTKAKSTRSSGRNKSEKKPIKVVYISNPMKVTTSASEFRALVQQLTGQDADDLPDLHPTHHDDNNNPKQEEISSRRQQQVNTSSSPQYDDDHDHDEHHHQQYLYADDVDGLFVPEMLDSFVPAPVKGFL